MLSETPLKLTVTLVHKGGTWCQLRQVRGEVDFEEFISDHYITPPLTKAEEGKEVRITMPLWRAQVANFRGVLLTELETEVNLDE